MIADNVENLAVLFLFCYAKPEVLKMSPVSLKVSGWSRTIVASVNLSGGFKEAYL